MSLKRSRPSQKPLESVSPSPKRAKSKWIGREDQVEALRSLIQYDSLPGIFAFGPSSTAKTSIVLDVLKQQDVKHVHVDCKQACSERYVFEDILNKLDGHSPKRSNNYSQKYTCDKIGEFVHHLENVLSGTDSTTYIVLDHAERLSEMNALLLPAFFRLEQAIQKRVFIIVIASGFWTKYYEMTAGAQLVPVRFPQYTRMELAEILCKEQRPDGIPEDTMLTFCNYVLGVFENLTRDLHELRHVLTSLLPRFEKIVQNSPNRKIVKLKDSELQISCVKLSKYLYHHEVDVLEVEDEPKQKLGIELPLCSKFLLIAGFLASYNPARTDKRMFGCSGAGKVRTWKKGKSGEAPKLSASLTGPKTFSLNRMVAIFESIYDDEENEQKNEKRSSNQQTSTALGVSELYSQVSSLVSLSFLTQLSGNPLEGSKLRCNVGHDYIEKLSKNVRFEIGRYLYQRE